VRAAASSFPFRFRACTIVPSSEEEHHDRHGPFDPALFGEAAVDAETAKLHAQIIELLAGEPECPALFSVGTKDALLDDTLFIHAPWVAAGNQAKLAIYPAGRTVSRCSRTSCRKQRRQG
jgi:hypothetical protein